MAPYDFDQIEGFLKDLKQQLLPPPIVPGGKTPANLTIDAYQRIYESRREKGQNEIVRALRQFNAGARPRLFSEAADIDDFGTVLSEVIQYDQKVASPKSPFSQVKVALSSVDHVLSSDTVTWRVKSRKPGAWGAGPPGSPSHRTAARHLMGVWDDPEVPNHVVLDYAQFYDNEVEVSFWSADRSQANRMAIELESLIDRYQWYFSMRGFGKILFLSRGEDLHYGNPGNAFYCSDLFYHVSTTKKFLERTAVLTDLYFHIVADLTKQ